MNLTCIINPRAGYRGKPRTIAEAVHRVVEPLGWQVTTVLTQGPGQATELAREAVRQSELVVAAGGDGTIHEVAVALVGTQAALGIIPCGSGNGLARALRVPTNMRKAVELLPNGQRRAMDVGRMNEHYFFTTAGVGLDAEIAARFNAGHHSRGVLPYFRCGASAWLDYEPEPLILRIGSERIEERPLVMAVANTDQYGAGAIIAPGALPDDGLLKVCCIRPVSFLRLVCLLPRLFIGTLDRSSCFRAVSVSQLTVERRQPGPVQIDGEPLTAGAKLEFSVLPKALQVLVPPK